MPLSSYRIKVNLNQSLQFDKWNGDSIGASLLSIWGKWLNDQRPRKIKWYLFAIKEMKERERLYAYFLLALSPSSYTPQVLILVKWPSHTSPLVCNNTLTSPKIQTIYIDFPWMIERGLLSLRKKIAIKNHKFPLSLSYTWRAFAQQLSCVFFGSHGNVHGPPNPWKTQQSLTATVFCFKNYFVIVFSAISFQFSAK